MGQGQWQDESQRRGEHHHRRAQARRKWRQRQSGPVRRSCGVCVRIETDLVERFLLLVEGHNRDCARRRWNRRHTIGTTTQ